MLPATRLGYWDSLTETIYRFNQFIPEKDPENTGG
jgi:hypothetical protein